MFVTMDSDLRAQIAGKAERLMTLLPPSRAAAVRAAVEAMNRDGGMEDTKLAAFRQLLAEYCRQDDGGASPEEEIRRDEEQSRDRRTAFELARLLMVRMQTLLMRAEMAQKRRNIRLERKR